jgi:hypothetical protein
MVTDFDAQFKAAEKRGAKLLEEAPLAASAAYDARSGRVSIELMNGCGYAFPARLVEDLQGATEKDLSKIEVDGAGFNLHWPSLEVDLYVPALVAGLFGTRKWMTQELARVAGRTTSPAKSAAARTNGAKGGRPRKTARG